MLLPQFPFKRGSNIIGWGSGEVRWQRGQEGIELLLNKMRWACLMLHALRRWIVHGLSPDESSSMRTNPLRPRLGAGRFDVREYSCGVENQSRQYLRRSSYPSAIG